jgi:TM2 domain-containing membrane protein YozV
MKLYDTLLFIFGLWIYGAGTFFLLQGINALFYERETLAILSIIIWTILIIAVSIFREIYFFTFDQGGKA